MKLAFLYAGQGSQHPGMGRDLYEAYPTFRSVLDSVQLDFDLKKVSFEGPAEVLSQTQYTQPCMVAFAAGVTSLLYQNGIRPSFAAGLSLGEYSALHAAGVLDARTAIELVAFRGETMARAATGRPSAMAAVLLLGREELQRCCEEAAPFGVAEIANLNCPGQTVIGGDAQAVAEAGRLALVRGAKRVIPLQVSGPFHTSLMAPAGRALEERFRQTSFGAMEFPVLFNCTGDALGPGETIPGLLVRQVQSAVRMEETLRNMAEHGVDTVVEVGPGRALSGFVKKTCKGVRCYGVETVAELEEAVAALRGAGA